MINDQITARLYVFIRENVKGGCKKFSLGDKCECPLCDLDRLLDASNQGASMSQHTELIARLRNTPNWQRESYGDWKNGTLFYDRAPFEAADALQAMERVPMTESGWLIECNIASGAPFWLKPDGDGTNDSNEALRFSRATDAQGFLDSFLVAKYGKDTMGIFKRHYSKEKYSVTEHMWMDSKSDKEPQ